MNSEASRAPAIQRENCSNRSKAQSSAWPEPRKKLPPRPSMLDRFKLGIM